MKTHPAITLGIIAAMALAGRLRADEGMWLFSAPPTDAIKARYGFTLTDGWLEHLMKSSVRFSGGSGSFVSADGLVITNHHVGAGDLQKLSDAQHNYLRDGFHAASPAEEMKCIDRELNVLQSIEDVTARVNAAVPPGLSDDDAFKARRKIIAEIEKESLDRTGLRSDVVTLYRGGAYHLYCSKRYTDIRLVFAPEQQTAFFGGDPDNFEYPRYNLDICLFRVYEDGQPAKVPHFLRWSQAGTKEGDLTFVSGHPAQTSRHLTMAELASLRDTQSPYLINRAKRLEVLLASWSARSAENARRARGDLFGAQNERKALDGRQGGLFSPALTAAKAAREAAFKERLRGWAGGAEALQAFERIAAAVRQRDRTFLRHTLVERGNAFASDTFSLARRLLRAGDERPKPNGERLNEYGEARRESFELALFSGKPIYPDLEILRLGEALTLFTEIVGFEDALVQQVLSGQSPRERAAALITGSKVRDMSFRRQLYEGGASAVAAAGDPIIELARLVDAEARTLRKEQEAAVETIRQAHAVLARARFTIDGPAHAPDATSTLRLSFGPVKAIESAAGGIPAHTTLAGLFERNADHQNREPFDLPPRWLERTAALNLGTPLNFINTVDVAGGNSGSPVVNTAGEFVGIIFDGNLDSLVWDFVYEDVKARSVSVDARAILEALRKVYDAGPLANELVNGHR